MGVENNDIDKFNSQLPSYYKKENETIKDVFTFHYVSSELMVEMYKILTS